MPLHVAIINRKTKPAKQLIKQGSEVETRNFASETPLMLAVKSRMLEVMRLLVQKGADIYEKNNRNENLLHLAAKGDRADIVGYLIDKGVSTMERNIDGHLPKDLAVKKLIKQMLQKDSRLDQNDLRKYYRDRKDGKRLHEQPSYNASSSSWMQNKEGAAIERQKLMNEALMRFKIDRRETVGSEYKDHFDSFGNTGLSRRHEEYNGLAY